MHLRETAEDAIRANLTHEEYIAAVVDVMMPPPEGKEGRTSNGLDTGLFILAECHLVINKRQLPVVLLTNRNAPYVPELVNSMNFTPGLVEVRPKIETPKFFLPHLVEKLAVDWKRI